MLQNLFIGPPWVRLLIFGETNLPHLLARTYFFKNLIWTRLEMAPRLGAKYPIVIETTSKPREECTKAEHMELDPSFPLRYKT